MEEAEWTVLHAFETKRDELYKRVAEMMAKAVEEGRTLDIDESKIFDNAVDEIECIDGHAKRLKRFAKLRDGEK